MEIKPDFERFMTALRCEEPDRVPLGEWHVDPEVKNAYMGRPVKDLKTLVEFWTTTGHDYVPLTAGILEPVKPIEGASRKTESYQTQYEDSNPEREWAIEGSGVITSMEEFERYPWPAIEDMPLGKFKEDGHCLPPGMRVILVLGKIYTPVWMLMGAEKFFMSLVEDIELVENMFNRVGQIQFDVFQRIIEHESVGAIAMPDDLAHNLGPLIHPKYFRQYLFPWYKKMGDICRQKGLGFILHSDGNVWQLMEDLIEVGYHGLHPIQPNAMDINEVKEKYGTRLCLMGNINLDSTLTLGTPDEVKEEVRTRIRDLAPGGGYCVASSNSITNYVPLENYRALLEAVREYGQYPIRC